MSGRVWYDMDYHRDGKNDMKRERLTPKLTLIVAAACAVYALNGAIRSNYGMIIEPLCAATGVSYAAASFAFGVAQLMYGVTQPLWGVAAMRRSNGFVLTCGVLLLAAGLFGTPFMHSRAGLTLSLGIVLASGTGALCFGILMAAITPVLGPRRAAAVSGILNASSGVGSAVFSPIIQLLDASVGIRATLIGYAALVLLFLPVVIWIGRLSGRRGAEQSDAAPENVGSTLREALRSRDYRALMLGFGTCGFHMTIIQTHFISQMTAYGISERTAALVYTAYGVATMAGAVLSGALCSRFKLKTVLGSLYGIRAVIAAVFLFLLPKTLASIVVFALILGMTGDATVTPTSEIVSRRFGAGAMGFLFGITFVCHQIGGFISSWLGGVLAERTGGFDGIWYIDIALCVLAAAVSFRITTRENE